MTSHISTLLVVTVDVIATVAIAGAGVVSLRVVLAWTPGSTDEKQVALNRWAARASWLTRVGALLFLASSALLVVSIAALLPGLIKGAMCGVGVLSAMDGEGERALWLRALASAALAAWAVLDRLDRKHGSHPIVIGSSRAQLLAATLVVVAVVQTVSAIVALDPSAPVSCCGKMFKLAAVAGESAGLFGKCVWCMFLEKNDHVGYPLTVALAIALLEGVAVAVAVGVAVREPELKQLALARVRRGAISVALAVVVFAALTVGPAVF